RRGRRERDARSRRARGRSACGLRRWRGLVVTAAREDRCEAHDYGKEALHVVNYTRRVKLPRAGVALLLVALVAACGIPRLPDGAQYCAMGFDNLEAQACRPGMNPEFLKYNLESYKKQCTDAASVARIKKIESTCLVAMKAAVRDMKDDRRKIRAKYLDAVSELLLDPAYPPLADRYRDSKDPAALSELG